MITCLPKCSYSVESEIKHCIHLIFFIPFIVSGIKGKKWERSPTRKPIIIRLQGLISIIIYCE